MFRFRILFREISKQKCKEEFGSFRGIADYLSWYFVVRFKYNCMTLYCFIFNKYNLLVLFILIYSAID